MKELKSFWSNASGTYKIDPEALHDFLRENGYYTFVTYEEDKIFVREKDKVIQQVSQDHIREFCWEFITKEFVFEDPEERKLVINLFYKDKSFLTPKNLLLIDEIQLNPIRDDSETSFLFFKNCIVRIKPGEILKLNYDEVEGNIWKNDIIDFEFTCEVPAKIKQEGEFYEFFLDITRNPREHVQEHNRYCLERILGYLVHGYKNPANAKAVILMDTYKDGNPQGGTGKGLFAKALEHVRPVVFQDGKRFKQRDNFVYSNVKYGTKIIVFDDVPRDFEFEKIFPLVTEKAVIERKHQNKFAIPFEDSPKVLITTNYTVVGKGSSYLRRKIEFIFSDVYTDIYGPEDKFGHLLYADWSQHEWEKFYLFVMDCVETFLHFGLEEPIFNVAERTLKIHTSQEFIRYADLNLKEGIKYDKKDVFESFLSKFSRHQRIEQNTFTRWLKLYADAYGMKMTESHSGDDNFFELIV